MHVNTKIFHYITLFLSPATNVKTAISKGIDNNKSGRQNVKTQLPSFPATCCIRIYGYHKKMKTF